MSDRIGGERGGRPRRPTATILTRHGRGYNAVAPPGASDSSTCSSEIKAGVRPKVPGGKSMALRLLRGTYKSITLAV